MKLNTLESQKYKFCPESPAFGTALAHHNFSDLRTVQRKYARLALQIKALSLSNALFKPTRIGYFHLMRECVRKSHFSARNIHYICMPDFHAD